MNEATTYDPSLTGPALAQRQRREEIEKQKLLAQLEQDAAREQAKGTTPAAPATGPAQAPAAAAAKPQAGSPGFLAETAKAIGGGVADFAKETIAAAYDLEEAVRGWLPESVQQALPKGMVSRQQVDSALTVAPNETTVGQVGRGVVQFAAGFIPAARALKVGSAATKTATAIRATGAGAIVDGVGFSPEAQRLSNLVLGLAGEDPFMGRAILEALAADPGDTRAMGRLKNMAEGAALGIPAEVLGAAVRKLGGYFRTMGEDPITGLQRAAKGEKPTIVAAEEEAMKAKAATAAGPDGGPAKPVEPPKVTTPAVDPLQKAKDDIAARIDANPILTPKGKHPGKVIEEIGVNDAHALVNAAKLGRLDYFAERFGQSPDFNVAHLKTDADIDQVFEAVSKVAEENILKATGGVERLVDTKKFAQELGTTTKSIEALAQDTNELARRVTAGRILLTASGKQTRDAMAKAVASGSDEDVVAAMKMIQIHAAIQTRMKGVQTEIARATSAFRIDVGPSDLKVSMLDEMLDGMGGSAQARAVFADMLRAKDPAKFNRMVRRAAQEPSMLREMYTSGLLYGPTTHTVQLVSNLATAVGRVGESVVQAGIGAVSRNPDRVTVGELKALTYGYWQGILSAFQITADGMKSVGKASWELAKFNPKAASATMQAAEGEVGSTWRAAAEGRTIIDSHGALDAQHPPALTAKRFGVDEDTILGRGIDTLGALVRVPFHALAAGDDLFKSAHYHASLNAEAYRQATREGLKGDAFAKRIAEIIAEPPHDIVKKAVEDSRYYTFSNNLGPMGRAVQSLANNAPGGWVVVPFIRTPGNIISGFVERFPVLGMMHSQFRADIAAGGARRDMALAKQATGGLLVAGAWALAEAGVIRGGGEPNYEAEKAGGIGRYSLKVGDKWYSFSRFDPIASFLGVVADLHDIYKRSPDMDMSDHAVALITGFSNNIMNKSWLSGATKLIAMLANPEMEAENWTEQLVTSAVPFGAALRTVRKEIDPGVKEVRGVVDALMAATPGLSKAVPNKVNILGEEVKYEGAAGPDILSPFTMISENRDPVARAIKDNNIDIKQPPRTRRSARGEDLELTPQQYHDFLVNAGKKFHQMATPLVTGPGWDKLSENQGEFKGARHEVLTNLYHKASDAAWKEMLAKDKALRDKFLANKLNSGKALAGIPVVKEPK